MFVVCMLCFEETLHVDVHDLAGGKFYVYSYAPRSNKPLNFMKRRSKAAKIAFANELKVGIRVFLFFRSAFRQSYSNFNNNFKKLHAWISY